MPTAAPPSRMAAYPNRIPEVRMNAFLQRFDDKISGMLNGFDRRVLRGALQSLAFALGMRGFRWRQDVLLKDFGKYVAQTTELLKEGPLAQAQKRGREVRDLPCASTCNYRVRCRCLWIRRAFFARGRPCLLPINVRRCLKTFIEVPTATGFLVSKGLSSSSDSIISLESAVSRASRKAASGRDP